MRKLLLAAALGLSLASPAMAQTTLRLVGTDAACQLLGMPNECVAGEQYAYDWLRYTWDQHSEQVKRGCVSQADNLQQPPFYYYREVARCLANREPYGVNQHFRP